MRSDEPASRSTSLTGRRAALVVYAVATALLAATIVWIGPVMQGVSSHDFFAIMEAGWKIAQGYHLYTDFHTLIGPIPYLILALGILIWGPVADVMPDTIALTLLPVAAITWHLLSSRFNAIVALGCATYLALLWCAPYPLHFAFFVHGYGMSYNRQSYVLLCLVFLSAAVRPRKNLYAKGVLLGLLFFFKIPYCVAGMGLVGFYILAAGVSRREIIRVAAGFLTSFLPVFIYLGARGTTEMFLFMIDAGRNRTSDVLASNVTLFWKEFPGAGVFVLALAFCGRWTAMRIHPGTPLLPRAALERIQVLAEPLVILFAAFLTEMASSPLMMVSDIPLVCAYAFLVLNRAMQERTGADWRSWILFGLPTAVLCLITIMPMGMRTVGGLASIIYLKESPLHESVATQIDGPGARGLKSFDRCESYPPDLYYTEKVNDGIGLIGRHPELDHSVIATLDFSDPFSFSLQRHSPPHMPVGLQYGFNVTKKVAPDPERIFDGCQAIMIPKHPDDPAQTVVILLSKYNDYLTRHFTVADQSAEWQLWLRRQP